ncbi:MAG: AAA family ATPase [Coriobacteriia bacterium]|nr:AAA family ATPase [Coriobacteriia bacterium]
MIFSRSTYIDRMARLKDTDLIKVITGVRRCGKSTLLRLFEEYLSDQGILDEQIVHIDFDDIRNEPLLDKCKFANSSHH